MKHTLTLLVIGILVINSELSYCQTIDSLNHSNLTKSESYFNLLVGYNLWNNHNFELGVAKSKVEYEDFKLSGYNYFFSTEVRVGNSLIVGPKIGFWGGSMAGGYGLTAIYYTDFIEGGLRLRPEVGLGMSRIKLAYGYNIALTNRSFDKVNRHNISMNILISLRTLKINK